MNSHLPGANGHGDGLDEGVGMLGAADIKDDSRLNGPDGAASLIAELRMELQAAEEWAGEKVPELKKLKMETESQKTEVDALKEQLAVWKERALKAQELENEKNGARVEQERDELKEVGKKMEAAEEKAAEAVQESEKKIIALKEKHLEELQNLKEEMRVKDDKWAKKEKTAMETIKRLEQDLEKRDADLKQRDSDMKKRDSVISAQNKLENEVASLKEIIQSKDDEIAKSAKSDKVSGLETTITKLKGREVELTQKVEDVTASLKKQIALLQDEKKELGSEKKKSDDATKQLTNKVAELEKENAKVKKTVATFEQEQWNRSSKASAQMEEAERELRKKITAEMSGKVTTLEHRVKSSEAENNTLKSRLANMERDLKGAKKKDKKQAPGKTGPPTPQHSQAAIYEEAKESAVVQMTRKLKKIKTTDCLIAFAALVVLHMLIWPQMWHMKK